MAQINTTVGDLSGNAAKVASFSEKARKLGCDLILFPELCITGYPPEDLLLKPKFIDDNIDCLNNLSRRIKGVTAVVGFVDRKEDIYNGAAIVHGGRVVEVYHKMYLPNYGVFDEQRYFQAGTTPVNFVLDEITVGVGICEDIWYPEGPARAQSLAGAQVIVNINASPYHMGKAWIREEMLITRAMDNEVIIAYNNAVGGQDELVFDGQGMIINEQGKIIDRGKPFEEDLIVADLNIDSTIMARLHDPRKREEKLKAPAEGVRKITLEAEKKRKVKPVLAKRNIEPLEKTEEILEALVMGTRDYVEKNGFKHVVIGLSGGVDSSLVASVATLALGRGNITGVFMPSRYTSTESREDAHELAQNLGIELITVPIDEIFESYLVTLKKPFKGKKPDITEENIQARIRGNILMALSNKYRWLVLTTGNKSEMSVGYATLYGDMAGGFAVIKDVPKTLVYELSRWINSRGKRAVIPGRVLTKAPTAELKPNQTDQDTLPPYEMLDKILKAYVEEDKSLEEIALLGFKKAAVKKVLRMVDLSEYKRRQAPPGVKITPRALGKDRRMPITNGYDDNGSSK